MKAATRHSRSAFTLLEMLAAIAIFATAMAIIYGTFAAVTRASRRGEYLARDIHHGDWVMEQLVQALRSAYYPGTRRGGFGLLLDDNGSGPGARDSIEWVKLGNALLPQNHDLAGMPHSCRFGVETPPEGNRPAAVVRAWARYGQPEDFDPDDIEPTVLSTRVEGFDCRVATNRDDFSGGWEWEDEWDEDRTNQLPLAIELTLYLEPPDDDSDPVELRRAVEIPVAPRTW